MKIKEAVKKHKKKLLIIGGVGVTSALALYGIKHFGKKPEIVDDLERIIKIPGWNLDKVMPEVGKTLGVTEYFQENDKVRCLFIDADVSKLGELGSALVESFEANPNEKVAITLEYLINKGES